MSNTCCERIDVSIGFIKAFQMTSHPVSGQFSLFSLKMNEDFPE